MVFAGAKSGVKRHHQHSHQNISYKSSNLGRHSMVTNYGYESQIVPLVTLDQALIELGLDRRLVTALKIDVEGYEPAVIAGASQTLERTNAVIVEYSPELNRASGLSSEDMVARLSNTGLIPFVLRATGGMSRVGIDELLAFKGQLDVIWIRAEHTGAEGATIARDRGQLVEWPKPTRRSSSQFEIRPHLRSCDKLSGRAAPRGASDGPADG